MGKPVRSSLQNLSIAYECALAIGNSLNRSEMLQEVIHTMVHKTNAHRGIIWVKNGEKELQPVASAGISMEDARAQGKIIDHQDVLNQIQKRQQFVLIYKDDRDFLQYCPSLTEKEESALIVPVTSVAIIHLVYASREIADEPLANLLASLSKKLSVAIEACTAHKNIVNEVQVRVEAEEALKKKTEKLISSEKELQGLYGESEQARKSLLSILEDVARKEKALKESESKLSSILSSIDDLVFVFDQESRFILAQSTVSEQLYATPDEFIGKKLSEVMPPHLNKIFSDAFDTIGKGQVAEYDYWIKIEGKTIWFSAKHSPRFVDGELIGSVAVVRDITERKRIEKALKDRVEFEKIVASISTSFINLAPDEINIGIEDALGRIGEFSGVDCSYHFRFFEDGAKTDNIHEWCARGIVPQIENLKGLHTADFPWFLEKLNRFEVVHIPRVADLPPGADAEKEILQSWDILSAILVPMVYGKTLVGFIGLDSVRQEKSWSEDDIALLRIVCEIFVNAMERMRVVNAIKVSEEKYRLLADNTVDCIWQTNLEFEFTYVNPSVLQMLGFTQDEWIGSSLSEHCSQEEMEFVLGLVKGLLKDSSGLGTITFEIQLLHKNGKAVTVEISSKMLFDDDDDGNPVGLQGITRDITERKAMENALRENEERLKEILEHLHTGIAIIDAETHKIVDINSLASKMIGAPKEEIIGNMCHKFICTDGVGKCPITDLGQSIDNSECELAKADGETIPILKTAVPVMLSDRQYLIDSFIDISERKHAEEALKKKADELEKFNRLAVGRELKMIELKKEINALLEGSGKAPGYKIVEGVMMGGFNR